MRVDLQHGPNGDDDEQVGGGVELLGRAVDGLVSNEVSDPSDRLVASTRKKDWEERHLLAAEAVTEVGIAGHGPRGVDEDTRGRHLVDVNLPVWGRAFAELLDQLANPRAPGVHEGKLLGRPVQVVETPSSADLEPLDAAVVNLDLEPDGGWGCRLTHLDQRDLAMFDLGRHRALHEYVLAHERHAVVLRQVLAVDVLRAQHRACARGAVQRSALHHALALVRPRRRLVLALVLVLVLLVLLALALLVLLALALALVAERRRGPRYVLAVVSSAAAHAAPGPHRRRGGVGEDGVRSIRHSLVHADAFERGRERAARKFGQCLQVDEPVSTVVRVELGTAARVDRADDGAADGGDGRAHRLVSHLGQVLVLSRAWCRWRGAGGVRLGGQALVVNKGRVSREGLDGRVIDGRLTSVDVRAHDLLGLVEL
eukprot:scaffold74285_cov72-Phaeocystis_antarctica.AAC.6